VQSLYLLLIGCSYSRCFLFTSLFNLYIFHRDERSKRVYPEVYLVQSENAEEESPFSAQVFTLTLFSIVTLMHAYPYLLMRCIQAC